MIAPVDIVQLNVGGTIYATRRDTLQGSDSFFSGLVDSSPTITDFFIDRDPLFFRYVLNWLRGMHVVPEDEHILRELVWEADFYAMLDMKAAAERALANATRLSISKSLREIATDVRRM